MTISDRTAEFVEQVRFDDIPGETIQYTKELASKILAAMVVGAKTAAGRRTVAYARAHGGPAQASALGTGLKFSLEDAVFINGVTCHAAELENDQFPSATSDITIFPVTVPLAETLGASGQDLLTASAVGIEVMHRIGMFPLSSKGITDLPFYGVIGAAVGAAKLLKLNRDQIKSAIGLAVGRAGGYIVNFGTDAHYVESAGACQDGIKAAQLAQLGLTGTGDLEKWLTDLLRGTEFDLAKVAAGLGRPKWRVHETWVKKYPCCFLTHRHIDMILDLAAERSLRAEDVAGIVIHVGPVDNVCNRPDPGDPEDARFSFHHIIGAILADGDVNSGHFTEAALADERIKAARPKVKVVCHADWPAEFMSGTAKLEVAFADGSTVVRERVQAKGGPDEPLTETEIERLYRKYTGPVLAPELIDRSWEMIARLDELDRIDGLIELLNRPEA